MREPRILTKGGIRYYSDAFLFTSATKAVTKRFYVRTDNQAPALALWSKAKLYANDHGYDEVLRELAPQDHH